MGNVVKKMANRGTSTRPRARKQKKGNMASKWSLGDDSRQQIALFVLKLHSKGARDGDMGTKSAFFIRSFCLGMILAIMHFRQPGRSG